MMWFFLTVLFSGLTTRANASCGERKIFTVPTITHGYPVIEGEWPWHASIYYAEKIGSSYKCGGILLDNYHVMTAAHCVLDEISQINPDILRIHLGRHRRLRITKGFQEHLVTKIFMSENYKKSDFKKSDIALLRLKTMVDFSDYVQPVCLPDFSSDQFYSKLGTAVGFGINEQEKQPDILQGADMPIVSPLNCLETNPTELGTALVEGTFCAGYQNGTGVCNGDSGGGIYVKQNDRWFVIGIISIAVSQVSKKTSEYICSQKDLAVFTDVPYHLDWIHQYTKGIPVTDDIKIADKQGQFENKIERNNDYLMNEFQPDLNQLTNEGEQIYDKPLENLLDSFLTSSQFESNQDSFPSIGDNFSPYDSNPVPFIPVQPYQDYSSTYIQPNINLVTVNNPSMIRSVQSTTLKTGRGPSNIDTNKSPTRIQATIKTPAQTQHFQSIPANTAIKTTASQTQPAISIRSGSNKAIPVQSNVPQANQQVKPQTQNVQPKVQQVQPKVQLVQPKVQQIRPKIQTQVQPQIQTQVKPKVQQVQPKIQTQVQPKVQQIQPKIQTQVKPKAQQQIQPKAQKVQQQVQPQIQNAQPKVQKQIQPLVQKVQPRVQQVQPKVQKQVQLKTQRFQQQVQPRVQQKVQRPVQQNIQKRVQQSQPRVHQTQQRVQQTQPRVQQAQPRVQQVQRRIQQVQPRVQQVQPRVQQVQPRVQQAQPRYQQPRYQQSFQPQYRANSRYRGRG